MSNEIREKDHEWVKNFHSNFDRLLASLEKLLNRTSDIERILINGYKEAYRYSESG